MSFVPYVALWVGLVFAAGFCLLAGRRVLVFRTALLTGSLLAIALWFFFRPEATIPSASIAGRQWAVDELAWGLTGIALLLLLSAAIQTILNPDPHQSGARSACLLGITAAALPAIWAADDRSRILGVAFFVVVWAAVHWHTSPVEVKSVIQAARPTQWLLVALFPMWLALAWPSARLLLMILAAAILLGIWPFDGWRRAIVANEDAAGTLAQFGIPIVVGAAVLAAGLRADLPTVVELAVATALGLLTLVAGLVQTWRLTIESLAKALGLGLAGLALLATTWTGGDALLASVRLAVFIPAVLFISATVIAGPPVGEHIAGNSRPVRMSPGLMGLAVTYLALAGLPLTAGFSSLSSLYEAWRSAGGWVLSLVLVILLSLWLAAVYLAGHLARREADANRATWLRGAALVLPIAGLLRPTFSGYDLTPLTWVVIAIPLLAGLLLGRFVPGLDTLDDLLRESVAASPLPGNISPRLRHLGRATTGALADALAILDGDLGLLWLFGLLLLLFWIA